MRSFDWLAYILVLGVLVFSLYAKNPDRDADSPEPAPSVLEVDGASLPPPSPFDEQILVQVEEPKDGIGTAFAVNNRGDWVTARHVVDGCKSVGLLIAPGQYVPATAITIDPERDLALITTNKSPNAVALDLGTPLKLGAHGYHVGYPQGRPGEVATRLMSRSKLVSRGRRNTDEPILAWAEIGRTRGLTGSLGGISGGPVFDDDGEVMGVIVAESPRRGRIYTASPASVEAFLAKAEIPLETGPKESFSIESYGPRSDSVRRNLQVVKVACRVSP